MVTASSIQSLMEYFWKKAILSDLVCIQELVSGDGLQCTGCFQLSGVGQSWCLSKPYGSGGGAFELMGQLSHPLERETKAADSPRMTQTETNLWQCWSGNYGHIQSMRVVSSRQWDWWLLHTVEQLLMSSLRLAIGLWVQTIRETDSSPKSLT